MTRLVSIPAVGARVRGGPIEEIGVPTWKLVEDLAVTAPAEALELFDSMTERELAAIVKVYDRWIPALIKGMSDRIEYGRLIEIVEEALAESREGGPSQESGPSQEATARELVGVTASRSGDPTKSAGTPEDARLALRRALGVDGIDQEIDERVRVCRERLLSGRQPDELRSLIKTCQLFHDALVRATWAIMAVANRELGEHHFGDVLRASVSGPMVEGRTSYSQLAEMTGEQIMQMTAETMRSHFSGPDADGSITVAEEADKYVMTFDPCGSGGRARRQTGGSEHLLATPAARVSRPHDWSWGQENVGLYCTHCAIVNEIMPIESVGFPKRVTVFNHRDDAPCVWHIYKEPRQTPEEHYVAVGLSRRPTVLTEIRGPKDDEANRTETTR